MNRLTTAYVLAVWLLVLVLGTGAVFLIHAGGGLG